MFVLTFAIPLGQLSIAGEEQAMEVKVCSDMSMMIICLVTAVMQFVTIFLYKNLKFQMNSTLCCCVLVWASMFVVASVMALVMPENFTASWLWPSVVSLASFFLTVMAWAAMKRDYKLLRSYDRLR
ncbi:MAG: DUF4293 domain-containing protein [Clostridium sp.]|nr:DUF4293 domain-containing protein [Clostridium sp.]